MVTQNTPKRILLVEDEAIIALAESKLLKRNGYAVSSVLSGEKAVARVNEAEFDLILMDIDLGSDVMDGTEAAEIILRDHDIPIVFLSSHTEPEIVDKTEGISSYGYIVKNSGETVLLASIRMAFKLYDAKRITEESELKYRNLFESMIEEVHLWEVIRDEQEEITGWRLVDINRAGLKAWGKTRAETIGKTADEIWPESHVTDLFMPVVKKIFEEGQAHTWESYFPGTDQTLFMSSVAFGEYFFSTGMDISDRKRIERSLQLSEKRLKEAQHIAKIGSWDMDIETGTGFWSDELFHLLGYEPGERAASYALFREHLHPEDAGRFEEEISEYAGRVNELDEVFRYITREGEERVAHSVGRVELDEKKKIKRVFGTFQDITETKRIEESYTRIERSFRMFRENANLGIAEVSPDNRIIYVNPYMCQMLGYEKEELLSLTVEEISHPEDFEMENRELNSVARSGSQDSFDYRKRFKHKSGECIRLRINSLVMRNDDGTIRSVMAILTE